jgi:predicted O-methyltransferase YrrM
VGTGFAIKDMRKPSRMSRLAGIYARSVYHPVSLLGRKLRSVSRRLRGVTRGQKTSLPAVDWQALFPANPIRLTQGRKHAGDVSVAELAILATAAAATTAGEEVVEIGTFDGRTTLNLALNVPAQYTVFTLDLPPDTAPKFALEAAERVLVEKPRSGRHFLEATGEFAAAAARIRQAFGDSATFDWSPHAGRAGLVFVDGSHAYDYVIADTDTALSLIAQKGVVIWHDYGVWDGVTRALEEIEASRHLGLRHVRGTSLVVWKSGRTPQ